MKQDCTTTLCQLHTYIIALGSNTCAQKNLEKACNALNNFFPNIYYTPEEITEAIGCKINQSCFINQMAQFTSTKSLEDIRKFFKYLEAQAGRTEEDKMQEIIKLDIDILMVDTTVLKPLDLERPYIKRGLKYLLEKQKINQIEKSFQTSC